jgi:hypothetical protein
VSPLVVTPKPKNPDEIHLCIDTPQPNRAILHERHITPTIGALIHDLNGATVSSKIDLNSGYHQLELAPESSYITTFPTHRGLRRYTRLNFGTSSAAEVFQLDAMQQVLSGMVLVMLAMTSSFLVQTKRHMTKRFIPFLNVYALSTLP